ncbi:MAG: SEL1-like repeat protein [Treponema sp.]|nr:SEL1-like repeat protein [Treponema sp.]
MTPCIIRKPVRFNPFQTVFKTVLSFAFLFLLPLGYFGSAIFSYWIISLQRDIIQLESQIATLTTKVEEQEQVEEKVNPNEEAFLQFKEEGETQKGLSALMAAAESGHTEAQRILGAMYLEGKNFAQDYNEALRLFELASASGDAVAMVYAGDIHYTKKNYREAWKCFESAEKLGNANAILRQALMYTKGEYVPKCEECAKQKQLSAQAVGIIDKELKFVDLVNINVSQDKEKFATMLRDEDVYRMAAESGDTKSMIAYAGMLLTGDLIKKDTKRAIEWYEKAAEKKNVKAAETLATLYENGVAGVSKNMKKSFKWYDTAAELGSVNAQYHCGMIMLNNGKIKEALYYFEKAGEKNHTNALYYIGMLYENGQGVSKDEKKSMNAYLASAKKGNKDAIRCLVRIYEKRKNYNEVKRWKKELSA